MPPKKQKTEDCPMFLAPKFQTQMQENVPPPQVAQSQFQSPSCLERLLLKEEVKRKREEHARLADEHAARDAELNRESDALRRKELEHHALWKENAELERCIHSKETELQEQREKLEKRKEGLEQERDHLQKQVESMNAILQAQQDKRTELNRCEEKHRQEQQELCGRENGALYAKEELQKRQKLLDEEDNQQALAEDSLQKRQEGLQRRRQELRKAHDALDAQESRLWEDAEGQKTGDAASTTNTGLEMANADGKGDGSEDPTAYGDSLGKNPEGAKETLDVTDENPEELKEAVDVADENADGASAVDASTTKSLAGETMDSGSDAAGRENDRPMGEDEGDKEEEDHDQGMTQRKITVEERVMRNIGRLFWREEEQKEEEEETEKDEETEKNEETEEIVVRENESVSGDEAGPGAINGQHGATQDPGLCSAVGDERANGAGCSIDEATTIKCLVSPR
eukprot:GEMP01004900.1.p1 GENE.GEMP01004900.1~~GEMP01004900.1.p1  ORF type:complete len:458 (+),score=158.16 GEMP01004900.1:55-1428(+)